MKTAKLCTTSPHSKLLLYTGKDGHFRMDVRLQKNPVAQYQPDGRALPGRQIGHQQAFEEHLRHWRIATTRIFRNGGTTLSAPNFVTTSPNKRNIIKPNFTVCIHLPNKAKCLRTHRGRVGKIACLNRIEGN